MNRFNYDSPIGNLVVSYSADGIVSLRFSDNESTIKKNDHSTLFYDHLDGYFKGTLKTFDMPLDMRGTDFRVKVWKALVTIPFGKTVTYLELATRLGDPKSIRAVAAANGANPIAIIVPCHRVIGSDGSLTGYAGGLWRKRWLLAHEQGEKQGRLFE